MATYLLAYAGGDQPTSEEAGAAVMKAWMSWFGSLGDAVVDGGNPFGPSATIGVDGSVSGGGNCGLTGYSIIRADDLATATGLAKGCPQLAANGSVEIYEIHEVM